MEMKSNRQEPLGSILGACLALVVFGCATLIAGCNSTAADPVDSAISMIQETPPRFEAAAEILGSLPLEAWEERFFWDLQGPRSLDKTITSRQTEGLFSALFPRHIDGLFSALRRSDENLLVASDYIKILHRVFKMPSRLLGENREAISLSRDWWLNWWEKNKELPEPELRLTALRELYLGMKLKLPMLCTFDEWEYLASVLPTSFEDVKAADGATRIRKLTEWVNQNLDRLSWDAKSAQFVISGAK